MSNPLITDDIPLIALDHLIVSVAPRVKERKEGSREGRKEGRKEEGRKEGIFCHYLTITVFEQSPMLIFWHQIRFH